MIAEVFDTEAISHVLPELGAGFDSAFHFPLQHALVETFAKGGSVNAIADAVAETMNALGQDRALRLVTMLDNHDMPRFMTAAPPGLSAEDQGRRYAIALTALFTLPGIPQIYQGDELGMLGAYPDNRRDMPAWGWDASTRTGPHDGSFGDAAASWSLVKRLSARRATHEALWRGGYQELLRETTGGANVLVFLRRTASTAILVVLGNDDHARELRVSLGAESPWPDGTALVDDLGLGAPVRLSVDHASVAFTLPPRTAGIYR